MMHILMNYTPTQKEQSKYKSVCIDVTNKHLTLALKHYSTS